MNIFIIEDESLYAAQLQMMVERAGHRVCGMTTNAEDTLRLFEQSQADMALIDINLDGDMNGLELGRWLKRFNDIPIIYITSHYDDETYFEHAKQLSAYAFLKKPIDLTQLVRTIELAFHYRPGDGPETDHPGRNDWHDERLTLVVRKKSKYINIDQRDITYISAEDKYCAVHLRDGSVHLERISLRDLSKKLSPRLFAQTHRSYLVNLLAVQETDTSEYTIKVGNDRIPLGDTYKDFFLRQFGV